VGVPSASGGSGYGDHQTDHKILYWDRDGYAAWAKRLEAGTFCLPEATGPQLEVRHAELAMLLGGIDPACSRR